MDTCRVCGRGDTSFHIDPRGKNLIRECSCLRCGRYRVHDDFAQDNPQGLEDESKRLRLSAVVRRANDEHPQELFTIDERDVEQLLARAPLPHPVDQIDMLIEAIAERQRGYTSLTQAESAEVWAARMFFPTGAGLLKFQSDVHQMGLLRSEVAHTTNGEPPILFALTLRGWERARELKKARGPGNQAFVAMWFHPDMDRPFDEGFAPALEATGYAPYRVDRAQHNNKIDFEIMAQIRRSKVLIADATGTRPSVYYEAGFAEGLGIPVLWCCCKDGQGFIADPDVLAPTMSKAPACVPKAWFDCAAFDTNHNVFTLWSDPGDLRSKLIARIQGLDLDLSRRRAG